MRKLLILPVVLLGVTAATTAFAAENVCDLGKEYKVLQDAVQSQPFYPSAEDTKKELSARVSLLSSTITCSKNDLAALKDAVSGVSGDVAGIAKDRVMDSVNEAIRFYDQKMASLSDQGIQGTKDVAKEIRNWRNNNIASLSDRVKNLVIWSSNQDLFDKASDRLSQSQLFVNSLKLVDTETAQNLYAKAKSDFAIANDLNKKANDALTQGRSGEETGGYIKSSLEALSTTYRSFLGIGGELNVALPSSESVKPETSTGTSTTASADAKQ